MLKLNDYITPILNKEICMSKGKRILCMVLVVFIAGMSFIGCAGSWAAFNKSTNFIANIGGKYIGGVVFWILGGIVSPITLFLDVAIFNVIEFWTGNNLLAAGDSFEQIDKDGNRVTAVKNDDGTLSLTVMTVDGETTYMLLEQEGDDFRMFDAEGVLLSTYSSAHAESAN